MVGLSPDAMTEIGFSPAITKAQSSRTHTENRQRPALGLLRARVTQAGTGDDYKAATHGTPRYEVLDSRCACSHRGRVSFSAVRPSRSSRWRR